MPKVYFTVDVEPDCPPFLWTHRGVDEGCPRLLDLFAKHGVVATLFCTGAVARRSPDAVRRWLAEGHELGCHGDEHVRLSSVPLAEAYEDVARATETLSRFAPQRCFRAPNLDLPSELLPKLAALGYQLDSSEGRHKHRRATTRSEAGLLRVPATTTSSVLRLPPRLVAPVLTRLGPPLVLFTHPWELVDLRQTDLRWDCRAGTGEHTVAALDGLFGELRRRGYAFAPMGELVRDLVGGAALDQVA